MIKITKALILDKEMPKNCIECSFSIGQSDGSLYCNLSSCMITEIECYGCTRHLRCPLKSIKTKRD